MPSATLSAQKSETSAPSARAQMRAQWVGRANLRRHFGRSVRRITALFVFDLIAVELARLAVGAVRVSAPFGGAASRLMPEGLLGTTTAALAILVGLVAAGAYLPGDAWRDPARALKGVAIGVALPLWASIDPGGMALATLRWSVVVVLLGSWIALWRVGVTHLTNALYRSFGSTERVIFVGARAKSAPSAEMSAFMAQSRITSLGWLSDRPELEDHLGHPSAVWEVLSVSRADTVVVCGNLPDDQFRSVIEASMVARCRLLSMPRYDELVSTTPRHVYHAGQVFTELTIPSLTAGGLLVKRLFDLCASLVALVFLSPAFGVIAILIKADAPGPVFFRGERVGFGGRTFKMLKFRTMSDGADSQKSELAHLNHTGDPRLFKIPDDPRVTRIGAFLRKWSLDELPQLLNVVRGDMALVGPRPFFEKDLEAYDDHHFIRVAARPGITGMWQVYGRSDVTDFEEVVRLDREYIDRWSFRLDMRILLRTIPTVLRRTGAY